jgi:SOS-response transcriptional repressor LexA
MIESANIRPMKTVKDIRRENARSLATEGPAKFAHTIESSTQQVNQTIGPNPTRNIGDALARRIESAFGKDFGWLDVEHTSAGIDISKKEQNTGMIDALVQDTLHNMRVEPREKFDANVEPVEASWRRVPLISFVQAGMMTEVVDPFSLGDGFEIVLTHLPVSSRTFALRIKGESMLPEYKPGDVVIIDPDVAPQPGDMVVAKNTEEEATFKKYRPRSTNERGDMIFELVPLNDDFPTLNSERDHLHIIGVEVEHRKFRRR